MTSFRIFLCVAALAVPGLAGCSGGMDEFSDNLVASNPFNKPPKLADGERHDVLASDQSLKVGGGLVQIGPALPRAEWSQAGGTVTNDVGNVAVDLTGATVWTARIGGVVVGGGTFGLGSTSHSNGRAVASGGTAVLADPTGVVTAVSSASGAVLWQADVGGSKGSGKGAFGGGAAIADGRVYVSSAFGFVVALDLGTGRQLWKARLSSPARSAPAVAGGRVIVVAQNNMVYAFDANTGAQLWSGGGATSMATLVTTSSPAIAGGLVIAPLGSGDVLGLDLNTGAQRWATSVSGGARTLAVSGLGDASSSPVVVDGVVYLTGAGGRTVAARLADGSTIWDQPIGSASTPIISGNAVFMVDLTNRAVALDRASGRALWSTVLSTGGAASTTVWHGPLMAEGRLVFASDDRKIAVVDAATGRLAGMLPSPVEAVSTPIVVGGSLLVYGDDGTLAALR